MHVKCAVRLTDNDGTHTGDNPLLSLNRGLTNWRVNPGRWNRPLVCPFVRLSVFLFFFRLCFRWSLTLRQLVKQDFGGRVIQKHKMVLISGDKGCQLAKCFLGTCKDSFPLN